MLMVLMTLGLVRAEQGQLSATLDVTYMSKYLSKGKRYFGAKSAITETVNIDLYGTGFGLLVHNRRANSSGFENKERFNYGAFYANSLFKDHPYKTDFKVIWAYYHYSDRPRSVGNKYEWILDFAWPKLLPGGLVPKYTAYCEYPAGSGYDDNDLSGWVHQFGLGYDLTLPELPQQPIHLTGSIFYRDGMGGGSIDHDWSHATFGALTKVKITDKLSFVPSIYYQVSMDDSVNEHNELYTKLSFKYKF